MGNNSDEGKQAKTEKPSPPSDPDMSNYPVYPDWAAVQAYYDPRVAMMPYLNTAVASTPATSPYIWAPPQSMIPPYPAFYAHYPQFGVPMVGDAPTAESPVKSSVASHGGFIKKNKESDELAMSIVNGNADTNECSNEVQLSGSEATNGSSGGSNGVLPGVTKASRKRNRKQSSTIADVKAQNSDLIPAALFGDNYVDDAPGMKSENMEVSLDLKNVKSTSLNVQQTPSEVWNERGLKRERRKLSNRESARRSRLRKQAETEELAKKVEALTSDNMNLKSEISKLLGSSAKLKLQNADLMGKLKHTNYIETEDDLTVPTVNFLERVNNSGVVDNIENESPTATLHQLLDGSPRTDTVSTNE